MHVNGTVLIILRVLFRPFYFHNNLIHSSCSTGPYFPLTPCLTFLHIYCFIFRRMSIAWARRIFEVISHLGTYAKRLFNKEHEHDPM